jgi:transcriptional regulator with XRE-family HTH domain
MIIQQTKAQYRLRELLEKFPLDEYMDRKRELAKRLNIGKPQLDRLIRGDSDPSGTQLKIMAVFFGCTVDALYQISST